VSKLIETVLIFVGQPLSLCQEIANMQSKSVAYVQTSVKDVLKNVKDTQIWTIVRSVHKPVEGAQKNVVRWLNKYQKFNLSDHLNFCLSILVAIPQAGYIENILIELVAM
jgi:hypothetical protein